MPAALADKQQVRFCEPGRSITRIDDEIAISSSGRNLDRR
jgi:hypothetical protein